MVLPERPELDDVRQAVDLTDKRRRNSKEITPAVVLWLWRNVEGLASPPIQSQETVEGNLAQQVRRDVPSPQFFQRDSNQRWSRPCFDLPSCSLAKLWPPERRDTAWDTAHVVAPTRLGSFAKLRPGSLRVRP